MTKRQTWPTTASGGLGGAQNGKVDLDFSAGGYSLDAERVSPTTGRRQQPGTATHRARYLDFTRLISLRTS
jgi:hypothetical protein